MRHSMNKWMAAVALLACAACSKNDFAIDNARLGEEEGVYGEIQPIIFDDPIDTRATINPANMMYQWDGYMREYLSPSGNVMGRPLSISLTSFHCMLIWLSSIGGSKGVMA